MKVVYAPLVSDVRNRFGGQVFTSWKGIPVVRRFAKPGNPNTTDQQEVRKIFQNLTIAYVRMGALQRAAWTSFAAGKPFIGRNRYIGLNVPALNGDVVLDDLVFSPGDASTIPPTGVTVTPGVGELVCTVPSPGTPTGWTLTSAICVALKDADWSTSLPISTFLPVEGEDLATPYEVTLTGLSAVLYWVGAFIKWLAPDGTVRYSASVSASGTPT